MLATCHQGNFFINVWLCATIWIPKTTHREGTNLQAAITRSDSSVCSYDSDSVTLCSALALPDKMKYSSSQVLDHPVGICVYTCLPYTCLCYVRKENGSNIYYCYYHCYFFSFNILNNRKGGHAGIILQILISKY